MQQQLLPLLRTAAVAGLLWIGFQDYQRHDLPNAALALAIALLASR